MYSGNSAAKPNMKIVNIKPNGDFVLQIGEDGNCLTMSIPNDDKLSPELKEILDKYVASIKPVSSPLVIKINGSTRGIMQEIQCTSERKEASDAPSSTGRVSNLIANHQRSIESARQKLMRAPLYIPPVEVTTEADRVTINIHYSN